MTVVYRRVRVYECVLHPKGECLATQKNEYWGEQRSAKARPDCAHCARYEKFKDTGQSIVEFNSQRHIEDWSND